MSVAAIETEALRKVFGDHAAVKGLTLQVSQGEVFGFLGPNGAGKTTSIKMLLGLVAPTSGKANLLGAPIGDRATLARIGFLPEHFARPWVRDGQLRAVKPRNFHFSSTHNVAYRASDAERPLIRAFLASLASQPSGKARRGTAVE